MTGGTHLALEQALACHRSPGLLGTALSRPLPADMLELVRLAAGDEALAAERAAASGETEATLVEAATFFILHVQFAPGADSYRVLGVAHDAADARIKEHYRWLVRWLHPDRNQNGWEAGYADRVNRAWNDLRLPDRRQAYDAQRPAVEAVSAGGAGLPRARRPAHMDLDDESEPLVSTRTAQRLPLLVLGTLGALAGALLMLMWYGHRLETPVREVAVVAPATVGEGMALAPEDRASVPDSDGAYSTPAPAPDEIPPPLEGVETAEKETVDTNIATADRGLPEVVAAAPVRPPTDVAAAQPPARSQPTPTIASGTPKPIVSQAAPSPAPVTPAVPATAVVPASTQGPAQNPAQAAYNEAEAHALLNQFTRAYVAGDIKALMHLFTRDASNNRGGRDAIAYDYQSLFSKSQERELTIEPTAWLQRDDGATVLARYSSAIRAENQRRPARSKGNIRFEFRRDAGVLRISQVRHDRD